MNEENYLDMSKAIETSTGGFFGLHGQFYAADSQY